MIDKSIKVLKDTRKYEVVIVDDGCPEKSGEIAKKYSKNLKTKVIFHKKNQGYGAAVKTGLKM